MAKKIIFCADGTWNNPQQDDEADQDKVADPTNVYKLFSSLAGRDIDRRADKDSEKELEKELRNDNGEVVQIAKYIHGVGSSENALAKIVSGVFGVGVVSRIVRGYTYISRNYEPGDQIYILGFSRGAYTARALAGFILRQGLLPQKIANSEDKEAAYAAGFKAWATYRRACGFRFDDIGVLVSQIGDLFAKKPTYVPVQNIEAVGVWDTVGAIGVPIIIDGQPIDNFKFTDTKLHPGVRRGFHAVSLDEQRVAFVPTLWDPIDARIEQVLFAGAHADVGGGYSTAEAGLSDIALQWMQDHFESAGVSFKPHTERFSPFGPDPLGNSHSEWTKSPWNKLPIAYRAFSQLVVKPHDSLRLRLDQLVIQETGGKKNPYRPSHFPLVVEETSIA